MKTQIAGLMCLILASCGPLNENSGDLPIFGALQNAVLGQDTAPAPPAISPEIANAAPGDVLLVTLRARGAVAPMVKVGVNGNRTTWQSPGKVTMTFENGVLVATRGLGDDLMGTDVPGLFSAIRRGSGTIRRQQSYLNSLDQTVTIDLECTIATAGQDVVALLAGPATLLKVTEDCKSRQLAFENSYWLRGGQIVRSLQAISATQGYIQTEQL